MFLQCRLCGFYFFCFPVGQLMSFLKTPNKELKSFFLTLLHCIKCLFYSPLPTIQTFGFLPTSELLNMVYDSSFWEKCQMSPGLPNYTNINMLILSSHKLTWDILVSKHLWRDMHFEAIRVVMLLFITKQIDWFLCSP